MSKREFRDYIEDIFQAIEDVETFIKGMNYKDFFNDRKTVHAVVRCIEIIGEAAKNIPKTIKDKSPDIAWSEIVGMRNKIAHEYFGVNYRIVWRTARHYLPKLKTQLSRLIKRERL